jgi:TldD protein
MLNDVAYQANTQEFWNSCAAVCDKSDYRLADHSLTVRASLCRQRGIARFINSPFKGVNVINTARKI